ncbi:MAG TPA: RNA polymerase sigma factor [Thermoleophilaceae bacterium]|jgi:RNA polymerase sigma-70 factor (ECF subfamily)|nr:RNA polymerase sigma factor [Thermoleophilaceae bacterium]
MARTDERADAELLASTSRDPEAFAVFYRRYAETILAYFVNRTQRREIAADLTAETFAAALAGAAAFRGEGDTAAGWLFGIARNKLMDSLRRGRVEDRARRELGLEPLLLDEEELEAVERRLDFEAHEAWLRDLLASLPAAQRQAILASVVDERPYAEIAKEMACSEAVVRKRVSRGLSQLRARMGER